MAHKEKKNTGGIEPLLLKMQKWCAYQDRSQHEARLRLAKDGITQEKTELVIAELITSGFLNDERFAKAFAGGKFRMKQWGRHKIIAELKRHKISDRLLKTATESLEEDDYSSAVRKLAEKKLDSLVGKDRRAKYYAVARFLVGKGFEGEIVKEQLSLLLGEIEEHEFRT